MSKKIDKQMSLPKSPQKDVTLAPLSFEDAIGGLLASKPIRHEPEKKPGRKK